MTSEPHHGWPDWIDDDDAWDQHGPGCLCADPTFDDGGPDDDFPVSPGMHLAEAGDVLDVVLPVIGPERAGVMALWCFLVDADDRTLPLVMPIGDMPMRPDAPTVANLVRTLDAVLDEHSPGGGVVFAVVRRTGGDRGNVELAWLAALERACADHDVRLRAVCAVGRDRARVLRW